MRSDKGRAHPQGVVPHRGARSPHLRSRTQRTGQAPARSPQLDARPQDPHARRRDSPGPRGRAPWVLSNPREPFRLRNSRPRDSWAGRSPVIPSGREGLRMGPELQATARAVNFPASARARGPVPPSGPCVVPRAPPCGARGEVNWPHLSPRAAGPARFSPSPATPPPRAAGPLQEPRQRSAWGAGERGAPRASASGCGEKPTACIQVTRRNPASAAHPAPKAHSDNRWKAGEQGVWRRCTGCILFHFPWVRCQCIFYSQKKKKKLPKNMVDCFCETQQGPTDHPPSQ